MIETIYYTENCKYGCGNMVNIRQNEEHHGSGRYTMTGTAIAFLCGAITASIILPGVLIILSALFLSLLIVLINKHKRESLKAALILVVFIGGMLNYSISLGLSAKLDMFDGRTAVYEFLILDGPVERGKYLQYTAESLSVVHEGRSYDFREKVFLKVKKDKVFRFGDKVIVEGIFSDIAEARNPGDFNYRLYYKSKGINKTVEASDAALLEPDSAGVIRTILYLSKEKVKSIINEALPAEEAAILTGIITGDKTDIDEDTRDAYMHTGLSHILSVSGLHVGFLMLLVTFMLKPFNLGKKTKGIITMSIITYYILLIGAPMPSVRALIMLGVLIAGKAAGRDYDLKASISFALMLILLFRPLGVHDPGFIISFGAMYSIALLHPVLYGILRFVPSFLRSASALSLSVWLGLAPILACYFNYISLVSIIINIVVVPLAFTITLTGFVGIFAGIVSRIAALYVFSTDYYLIKLLTFIIKKAAELPTAGFYIPTLPAYLYGLYYVGIGLTIACFRSAYFRIYIRRLAAVYLIAAAVLLSVYNMPSSRLKLIFFDVGQGDSCCIITPGKKVVLVDGGGSPGKGEYYYDVGGKITVPALLHQGVWRIDTVVVSHLHDDHMEGLLAVMEVYPVKNLILPRFSGSQEDISGNSGALLDKCREKGTKVYRMGKGDYVKLGDKVRMDFLSPVGEARSNENENSLVGMLTYQSFRALFTGDIGKETEAGLPAEAVCSSVLKVPHHGSGLSSSEGFIEGVKPRVSVISVGKNNYGHPSPDAMKRLNAAGSMVYRTDEAGAVVITTDGKHMKVKTVRR